MNTPAKIKSQLKLLELPGIAQVIHECVRETLSDCNDGAEGIGEVALGRYTERVIGRVKTSLRLKLKTDESRVKQMDIEEESIKEQLKREGK